MLAIVGTGTDVGKTWNSIALIGALHSRGRRVAARKPAQSFAVSVHGAPALLTDADLLAAATAERPHDVCPAHRWYPLAMAPPMAADVLGEPPLALEALLTELRWPAGVDVGIVETAGGVCSPLAHDADCATFVRRIDPDHVVLVADAGLGALNAVRLAMRTLDGLSVHVVLNRYNSTDELHRRNREWLSEREGFTILVDVTTLAI